MRKMLFQRLSNKVAMLLACASFLLPVSQPLFGQQAAVAPATDHAPNVVQPSSPDYRFEVASIRPADPPNGHPTGLQGYTGRRYRETNVNLTVLVLKAFRLDHVYQWKYPSWMNADYFDVNATVPEGATKTDLPVMLQHLLEDRFNLKYHYETKQMRGYELIVARPDPRLAKSTTTPDPSLVVQGTGFQGMCFEVKNGVPVFGPNAPTCGFAFGGNVIWHGRNRTMSALAGNLADKMNAPVIDSTGLEGPYNYTLTYPKQPADEGGESAEIPSMLDALQQQLGLKLLPLKNVPVQVFILDSINKTPSPN